MRFFKDDPRVFQVFILSFLLVFGVLGRDLALGWEKIFWVTLGTLAAQLVAVFWFKLSFRSLLSALITAQSVLLLMRSDSVGLLVLAGTLSIGSKFAFRWKGKHFFNPSNFGIVLLLLLSESVWVSPGLWGHDVLLALTVVFLGMVITHKTSCWVTSFVFLGTYALLLGLRVWYLGYEPVVWLFQLKSGALLIFSFLMISDPRSTPDHIVGRVAFAVSVALLAFVLRFEFYNANGLLLSLFFLSPITLWLDNLWKSSRFEWAKNFRVPTLKSLGAS